MIDSNDYPQSLYAKGYRLQPDGSWSRPPRADRVAPATEQKPDTSHEPVAEDSGAGYNPGFRIVRITSFRKHLLDERNLWDHYFTDSLVKAGLLRDDSPQWCKIEVSQFQVSEWGYEHTEIEIIEPL